MNQKLSIYGVLLDEIEAFCRSVDQPAFRAKQIWDWLYVKRVSSAEEMQNLPAPFRDQLIKQFGSQISEDASLLRREAPCRSAATFQCLEIYADAGGKLAISGNPGETQKLLFKLSDDELIETVIIPAPKRGTNTVCVSSQVGCRFGCAFCASGQKGVIRNLTAGEIVGEVMEVAKVLGGRPDNVVFMGIGEPFDNYDEVMKAVRIMNHPDGLCIGARRITISTCGVISGIQRLAEEGLQVELSVSLHAPDEETRSKLMPVNETWPLDELLAACADYTDRTKRIITFEYTLIKDVNDSAAQARQLAKLLKRFACRVNLIPLSPVEEFDGERPDSETMQAFAQVLERAGINTTLRDSKGSALKAACGQLRARRL